MTIVVAGGTGFLGSALVNAWRTGGHRVLVLTRRPRGQDDIAWTTDPASTGWSAFIDGADVVVNLAGEGIADKRWTTARKTAILDSRVRATRALASAINTVRKPPPTFISSSAVGIYGTTRGDELLTEASAPGSDFLAAVCSAWEAEATRVSPAATRVVLVRTGVVLSRDAGALPQMALPFRFFAGGRLGSGRQYVSWIHLRDWVAMVQWAVATAAVVGPLNATAPQPVTQAEFARDLGRAMNRPALVPTPAIALRLGLGEMADALLLGGQRVLPAQAQRLGFQFTYPQLTAALAAVFAETPGR